MNKVTITISDTSGTLDGPASVSALATVGLPGPRGPGIFSNITRITASIDPPANPEVNDLWIDLT